MAPCPSPPLPSTWPNSCDRHLCLQSWLGSTAEERQELCAVEHDHVVLNFRVCEQLLLTKLAQADTDGSAKAVAVAKSRHGLREVVWNTARRPYGARMSLSFCEFDEAIHAMFNQAVSDYEEYLAVMRLCYGPGKIMTTLHQKFCGGWAELASAFFTVVLAQMVGRCQRRLVAGGCVRGVLAWVDAPKPPPCKLRSWPPRRVLQELRLTWAAMTAQQRVHACTLTGAACWFVRACDLAIGVDALRHAEDLTVAVEFHREHQRLRIDAVEGLCCELEPVLRLSEDFAAEPESLEHLLRHAVHSLAERSAVLTAAKEATQLSASAAQAQRPAQGYGPDKWTRLAQAAFTLFLDALLRWRLQQEARGKEAAAAAERAAAEKSRQRAVVRQQKQRRRAAAAAAAVPPRPPCGPLPQLLRPRVPYWVFNTFVAVEDRPEDDVDDEGEEAARAWRQRRRGVSCPPACCPRP